MQSKSIPLIYARQICGEIVAIGIQGPLMKLGWLAGSLIQRRWQNTLVLWILRRKRKAQRVFTHPGGISK